MLALTVQHLLQTRLQFTNGTLEVGLPVARGYSDYQMTIDSTKSKATSPCVDPNLKG